MAEMLPIIADTAFNRLGVIDDYISFIWTIRYYECGDFELCANINAKSLTLLKKDYYVMRNDDEHIGIIENIKIQRNEDNQQMIIATGRFLSSILGRRIIAVQTQVSGTVENCVKKLITQNAISPTDSTRIIPGLQFGTFTNDDSITMRAQYTGKNLLEVIVDICKTNGCGFKTVLTADNKFSFFLFDGVDRSYDQNENPHVVFSNEYDNLTASDYEEDYSGIVTDVLVAGEGEGLARKTIWARKEVNSGLARYEIYQDARNTSTNDGEISDEVYYEELENDGLESITTFTQAFAGTVYFENIVYREDVNIGDICVIENTNWGLFMNARLVEVIESVSEDGAYSVVPSFEFAGATIEPMLNALKTETSEILLTESNEAILLEG